MDRSIHRSIENAGKHRFYWCEGYGKGSANASSDVDLLVDSGLKGLKFVGLIEALRAALDRKMDVFDVSHVERGTEIDHEIAETGVKIYEK